MKVIVDTGAWLLALRRNSPVASRVVQELRVLIDFK